MTFVPVEPYLPRGEEPLIRQLTDLWRNLATTANGHSAALGTGFIADRPTTPNVPGGTVAFWYASDTNTLSVWDGATWADVSGGGGGGSIEGAISIQFGTYLAGAADLTAGTEAVGMADGNYTLSGTWYLWCYPSGSIEIDVWKDTYTNVPVVADSITGGSEPAVVAGTFATGSFTGPVSVSRTNTMLAHINSCSGVKWANLVLIGDRV